MSTIPIPTENCPSSIRELLDDAIQRQDNLRDTVARTQSDLRDAEVRRLNGEMEAERRRVNEQLALRADYSRQLDEAESKRIDAIRAVDVAAVAVASERATQSAGVLATQVSQSAETLRTLVASTAVTIAQQLSQLSNQLSDRISVLEKSNYEGIGKGRIVDPVMAELAAEIKSLRSSTAENAGKTAGMGSSGTMIMGAAVLISTLISIYSIARPTPTPTPTPTPVYVQPQPPPK